MSTLAKTEAKEGGAALIEKEPRELGAGMLFACQFKRERTSSAGILAVFRLLAMRLFQGPGGER